MPAISFEMSFVSENSIYVLFSEGQSNNVTPNVTQVIANCRKSILNAHGSQILDCIPSYQSLLITLDPQSSHYNKHYSQIHSIIAITIESFKVNVHQQKEIAIPVYFGQEVALDLNYLSQAKQLSETEIIKRYCENTYTVFAIGFLPGFAFLGFVDPQIAHPRKETPRQCVPAGSLGIADQQTGIYPTDSPGGWNIIGKTAKLLDQSKNHPIEFQVGDKVSVFAISKSEFLDLGGTF